MEIKKKLVIIGGGPSGLAAAISANKNGIESDEILILEREKELGGILNQCIHAGFGLHRFGREMTGPEYAEEFANEVIKRKIGYFTSCMALSLDNRKNVTFVSPQSGFGTVKADAVILAMGCRERPRGALGINGSRPSGIYTAGTAQKYVNTEGYLPGKKVVILGSGDIGLIMARRMTLEGAKVLAVCELMPYSGGLQRNIAQCLDDFDIPLYLSHTVTEIKGRERLEGITIAKVDENRLPIPGSEQYIECDTLLLSCGLIPENELTKQADILIDKMTNGAVVNENRMTGVKGIFACGNVLHVHDVVDYVSEESEICGRGAAEYILNGMCDEKKVAITAGDGARYIVPQFLSESSSKKEAVKLYFRVSDKMKKSVVELKSGDETLISLTKPALTPSEMQYVTLKPSDCIKILKNGGAVISVREKEEKKQ